MKTRNLILAVAAVCLVQTTALAHMINDRMALLRDGEEIVLQTQPIDPRSLFRGHYVRLNYGISRVPFKEWSSKDKAVRGEIIFVSVKRREDGFWISESAHREMPPEEIGRVVVRGKVLGVADRNERIMVDYGIDRFYAPKHRALELEKNYRQQAVQVVIAVDPESGEAAIKALIVEGKRVYEEKMF